EPRWTEASQVWDDRLHPASVQGRQNAIPGANIVGPSMQQNHWIAVARSRDLVGDEQRRCFDKFLVRLFRHAQFLAARALLRALGRNRSEKIDAPKAPRPATISRARSVMAGGPQR